MSRRRTFANTLCKNRTRVLVIDADPAFRGKLVSILRREFLVSVASDGADGFRKALEHPPDIVVTEIALVGWDGLRTIKAFRSAPELAHVNIVVLTEDASRATVLSAIRAGANEYVIKTGFSGEEFVDRLMRLRHRGASSLPAARGATSQEVLSASGTSQRSGLPHVVTQNLQAVIDAWE